MGCIQGKTAKLSEEEMKYLLEHTHFSKDQLRKWYKGFMEDCPDGQLNRSTFLNMYSTFFPDGKARLFYEHLFRTFDQDDSGNIDFREFIIAISTTQSGNPEEKLNLAFQLYDIDRNGTIEESEMTEIIKAIYLMVGETHDDDSIASDRTKAIFQKMDTNHDNVLTKQEFVKGCLEDAQLYELLACPDQKN